MARNVFQRKGALDDSEDKTLEAFTIPKEIKILSKPKALASPSRKLPTKKPPLPSKMNFTRSTSPKRQKQPASKRSSPVYKLPSNMNTPVQYNMKTPKPTKIFKPETKSVQQEMIHKHF